MRLIILSIILLQLSLAVLPAQAANITGTVDPRGTLRYETWFSTNCSNNCLSGSTFPLNGSSADKTSEGVFSRKAASEFISKVGYSGTALSDIRITGYITITKTGEYEFCSSSYDNGRLFINGLTVAHNRYWDDEDCGKVQLSSGQHNFEYRVHENGNGSGFNLFYKSMSSSGDTGGSKVCIFGRDSSCTTNLSTAFSAKKSTVSYLQGDTFTGSELLQGVVQYKMYRGKLSDLDMTEPKLTGRDFIGTSSPDGVGFTSDPRAQSTAYLVDGGDSGDANGLTLRYSAYFYAASSGWYTFKTEEPGDTAALFINGYPILTRESDYVAGATSTQSIYLNRGEHKMVFMTYNWNSWAGAKFYFKEPSDFNFKGLLVGRDIDPVSDVTISNRLYVYKNSTPSSNFDYLLVDPRPSKQLNCAADGLKGYVTFAALKQAVTRESASISDSTYHRFGSNVQQSNQSPRMGDYISTVTSGGKVGVIANLLKSDGSIDLYNLQRVIFQNYNSNDGKLRLIWTQKITQAGNYTFRFNSIPHYSHQTDDDVWLRIDGAPVYSVRWEKNSPREVTKYLSAGTHTFELLFAFDKDADNPKIDWKKPGSSSFESFLFSQDIYSDRICEAIDPAQLLFLRLLMFLLMAHQNQP